MLGDPPTGCSAPAFFFQGGRDGVLLVHGLSGTPTEMRTVGRGFKEAGFTVYAPTLAGHCADEAALIATGWREWRSSVEEAAERLRERVDRLYVAGLSMGAVLALDLAARRPQWVDGLALYGTTLRYDGWSIPWTARFAFLLPWVVGLGIGHGRRFAESYPYGIKDERTRKRVVECMRAGDSAHAGLLGIPWPSLAQFYELAAHVRDHLNAVHAPCLFVHALNDDIASPRNAQIAARKVAGPARTLWLEESYHLVTLDCERHRVISETVNFFKTAPLYRDHRAPQLPQYTAQPPAPFEGIAL